MPDHGGLLQMCYRGLYSAVAVKPTQRGMVQLSQAAVDDANEPTYSELYI